MNTAMEEIRKLVNEAFNYRNDGWTQNYYIEQLIEIRDYLNSLENLKMHREGVVNKNDQDRS